MLCVEVPCECMFVVVDLDGRQVCSAMVMNLMLAWLFCVHAGWCAGLFASFHCHLLFRDSGLSVGLSAGLSAGLHCIPGYSAFAPTMHFRLHCIMCFCASFFAMLNVALPWGVLSLHLM